MSETVRVFWMLFLGVAAGALFGLLAGAETIVMAGGIDPGLPVLGAVSGFYASGIAVPALWRRSLWRGYAIVVACGGLLAVLAGAALNGYAGVMLGAGGMAAASLYGNRTLPLVFPEPMPGLCVSCGYDLRGQRGGPCPECGEAPDRPT